jgi:hypothetical protein
MAARTEGREVWHGRRIDGRAMDEGSGAGSIDVAKLRDLFETSMRRAEDSTRSLLGEAMRLTLCGDRSLPGLGQSVLPADDECGPAVGLHSRITGQGSGRVLILVPMPMARRFVHALLGRSNESEPLTEMEQSAIQEVGNIMSSSFLSRLGDLLGRPLLHSVPELYLENIPQLIRDVRASAEAFGSRAVVVQGLIEEMGQRAHGHFFLVSDRAVLGPVAHAPVNG